MASKKDKKDVGYDAPGPRKPLTLDAPPVVSVDGAKASVAPFDLVLEEWREPDGEDWFTAFVDDDDAATVLPHWIAKDVEWRRIGDVLKKGPLEEVEKPPEKKKQSEKKKFEWVDLEKDPETQRDLPRVLVGKTTFRRTPVVPEEAAPEEENPFIFDDTEPELTAPAFEQAVDGVGVSLFKVVASFGGGKGPLLWDAIYPQDATGRPCYNPAGKYLLKLWLAGKWRRVLIDDRLPFIGNDVVIASSCDNRELWPSLLVKGLYKVWAKLGGDTVDGFFNFAARALIPTWNPFPLERQSWWETLPSFRLEDVLLTDTAEIPGSPSKSRHRRKRRSKKVPPPEVLQAAADARNTAASDLRSLLSGPRDLVVVHVRENRLAPALASVSHKNEASLLTDWDAPPPSVPDDFLPVPPSNQPQLTMPNIDTAALDEFTTTTTYEICARHDLLHDAQLNLSWHRNEDTLEPPAPSKPVVLKVETEEDDAVLTVSVVADRGDATAVLHLTPLRYPTSIEEEDPVVALTIKTDEAFPNAATSTTLSKGVYRVWWRAPLGMVASFWSNAPLALESLDSNENIVINEGEHTAVAADTERVVFRRVVRTQDPFLVEMWLATEEVAPHFRLTAVDLETLEAREVPIWNGKFLASELRGSLVLTATILAPNDKPLPGGAWALYATFGKTVGVLETVETSLTSFQGAFHPNDTRRLFRDVLEAPADCFPLHLQMDVKDWPVLLRVSTMVDRPKPEEQDAIVAESKLTSGSAGDLILQVQGQRRAAIPCLWPREAQLPAVEEKKKAPAAPMISVIIEAALDVQDDALPQRLQSLKPHAYSEEDDSAEIRWRLDISAAKDGVQLRHDAADDFARFALRRSWEKAEPGRAERAAILRGQLLAARASTSSLISNDDSVASTGSQKKKKKDAPLSAEDIRIKALKIVPADVEAARQELRRLPLPPALVVEEEPVSENPIFLTQDDRAAEAKALDDLMASSQHTYDLVQARILDAITKGDDAKLRFSEALQQWRDGVAQTTLTALQRREAYRLTSLAAGSDE